MKRAARSSLRNRPARNNTIAPPTSFPITGAIRAGVAEVQSLSRTDSSCFAEQTPAVERNLEDDFDKEIHQATVIQDLKRIFPRRLNVGKAQDEDCNQVDDDDRRDGSVIDKD